LIQDCLRARGRPHTDAASPARL